MEHMKGIGLKFNFRGSGGQLELSGGSFEGCIRVFDQDKVYILYIYYIYILYMYILYIYSQPVHAGLMLMYIQPASSCWFMLSI